MSDDREEVLEAWKKNPEVDWNADNEGVLSFRVHQETDTQGFWLTDVDPSLSLFTNDDEVSIGIDEETEEGRLSAGLQLTPAEAQRLGRQLIFAGETAEEGRNSDVRL